MLNFEQPKKKSTKEIFEGFKTSVIDEKEPIISQFESIANLDDLHNFLVNQDLLPPTYNLTQSDYEAIVIRAGILKSANPEWSETTILSQSFMDRLSLVEPLTRHLAESIPVERIQDMMEEESGRRPSVEGAEMYRKSILAGMTPQGTNSGAESWAKGRGEALIGVDEITGVVNTSDEVLSLDTETPANLLKRVSDE